MADVAAGPAVVGVRIVLDDHPALRGSVRRFVSERLLLPRLWSPQRHPARSDAHVQHRSRHQPRRAHTPATAVRASHPTYHCTNRHPAAVERRQVSYCERPLAGAARTETIDRQIEAVSSDSGLAGNCDPLATGGGVCGCYPRNIERTSPVESVFLAPHPALTFSGKQHVPQQRLGDSVRRGVEVAASPVARPTPLPSVPSPLGTRPSCSP